MDMARFFITLDGLAAALSNPRVLKDITALIAGDAPKSVEKEYLSKGLVSPDRRTTPKLDDNLKILGEALVSLERVAKAAAEAGVHHNVPKNGNGEHTDDPQFDEVRDLRRTPRKLYRLSAAAERVTTADLKKLPSGARHVFAVLRKQEAGTTSTITEASGLNRRTVENSLSSLRRAGLLEDIDFKR